MERQRQSGRYGQVERAVEFGCRAVFQQLEQRRFLSADGLVAEEGEEVIADDSITMELMIDDGGEGEVKSDEGGGEVPEEWMYMTMMPEEGGEGEPLEDGEIRLTMVGEDGEPLPADGELQDWNGDGVIDQYDEIMTTTVIDEDGEVSNGEPQDWNGDGVIDEQDEVMVTSIPSAVARSSLKNGRLVIRGTAAADTIDVAVNGAKLVVTINGVAKEYDKADVNSIKVKARGGNDDVSIASDLDAHVNCGKGNDSVTSGGGDDTVNGGKGDDDLSGGAGDDLLRGARGKDALDGGDGDDELSGGAGADDMAGGVGNDGLRGGRGRDNVDAGEGDDLLDGGAGLDQLHAGPGTDAEQDSLDDILDLDAGDDLFSSLRIAMPDWWDNDATGDAAQGTIPSDTDDTLAPEDEAVA